MTEFIVQWIVPVFALVVLAALLVTASPRHRTFTQAAIGTAGVVIGGPLAMLMLGALAAKAAEPSPKKETAETPPAETQPDRASSSSDSSSSDSSKGDAPDLDLQLKLPDFQYPSDYPEWAEADPQRQGNVHRNFVSSGPHSKRLDCLRELDKALVTSTNQYIDEYLGIVGASKYLHYDLAFIKNHLLDSGYSYSGTIVFDVGRMREEHRALRFDSSFRSQLDDRWGQVKAQSRLWLTLLGAGGVLGLLATIFTYFRLDNATRGFYTGRLQFGTLAAILGIVAAGVMVARWIPWM